MKNWYNNVKILWSIIGLLSAGIIYFVSLIRSYQPEINRLRLENIVQDSIITFQKIDIERLTKKVNNEFDNIYDVFHTQNNRIKELKEN